MMADFRLIAALVVALSAIVLQAEARRDFRSITRQLREDMDQRLSPEDQADAEKAFSFAQKYIQLELEWGDQLTVSELLPAWERVLHKPDYCDESSLRYIETIAECQPQYSNSTKTLAEATKKYALNCLTPAYIKGKIDSLANDPVYYCYENRHKKIAEFIDDDFIADYWSEHPKNWKLENMGKRATKAIAKAIIRDRKNNIKDLGDSRQVHAYLDQSLYISCFHYLGLAGRLMDQISVASDFLEGGYDQLISSLDNDTRNAFFRFHLCTDDEIWHQRYATSEQFMSDLKSLTQS